MRLKGDALKKSEGDRSSGELYLYSHDNELENMISVISKRTEDEYYLFKQDFLKDWTYISTLYSHNSTKKRMYPDYINFYRKYMARESDYELGLYNEDELGEFDVGWLKKS